MSPATALTALSERAASEGDPLSAHVVTPAEVPVLGELVASGPRTAAAPAEYAFVVEAVREGYLCHYGTPRVLEGADSDLELLAGDLFYAIGISGLAALDDLESVGILSDLIRISAGFRAAGESDRAEALWLAQLLALSCGITPALPELIKALRRGEPGSTEALNEWSSASAGEHGLGRAFLAARKAIDSGASNL
ncbi:MAG: hypothetical protein IPK93_04215 [Solirubrobacterales bacterium]|nr:hypothetical protein [Solirubrobacterales bacterium]